MAVGLALFVALGLLVVASLANQKQADAATRLVTKSFSNSRQITIPEGAPTSTAGAALPYPSAITSSFPRGSKVRDVNVTLRSYTHTFPDDVDVLLVHAGKNRTIMSDAGGDHDVSNITIKLDDEAFNGPVGGLAPGDTQLAGGTFKPFNYSGGDAFDFPAPTANAKSALSGFDGLSARRGWKLFVDDNGSSDVGKFAGGWTVHIKAAVPQ